MIALIASTKLITGSTNVAKIGGALMAVGITFQLMARTVKILGKMDKDQLKQGTKALALFETMIIGLMAATRLLTGSKNVDHIGKTLASVGVAILLMGVTTKLLGTMDKEALIKGVAGVSAFIALIIGLIYGIKKVGGKDINNINKTLIGVTACIAVMSLSAALLGIMSLGNLAKGIIAVGFITYFVTLLVTSTEKARNLGKSLIPLTVVDCRPIGVIEMFDGGKRDSKIIAVAVDDPFYNTYKNANDLPNHIGDEIKHFFDVYKNLENKTVTTGEVEGVDAAKKVIKEAIELYKVTKF